MNSRRGAAACLGVAALTWIVGAWLGTLVKLPFGPAHLRGSYPGTASGILSDNFRVVVTCVSGLVTFGLSSFLTLFLNGLVLGITWRQLTTVDTPVEVLGRLWPHGSLEIPGLMLAGAVGLSGVRFSYYLYQGRLKELRSFIKFVGLGLAVALLLILTAALIESMGIRGEL